MIPRTTRISISPSARGRRCAYSLIELLIVLTLLALMVGLSWPAVQRLSKRGVVKEAAKQMRTELSEARLRAIESGTPQIFRFRPGSGYFEVRPKEEETSGPAVLKSTLEQMADTDPVTGATITSEAAYQKSLPEGMFFASQEVAEEPAGGDENELLGMSTSQMTEQQAWSDAIIFYPNGRTSNANLRLTDGSRYQIDISLRGLTGAVRIGPTTKIQRVDEQDPLSAGLSMPAEGFAGPPPLEARQ